MNHSTEDSFSTLLDLAANNDVDGFKRSIENDCSAISSVYLWYGRQKQSKQMVLEPRTPLMVAAMYGSVDVLKLIISKSEVDVNFSCGSDRTTALHCAVSGGSVDAVEVVNLLLLAGADPTLVDASGRRPVDVIVVPRKLLGFRASLEDLLTGSDSHHTAVECTLRGSVATLEDGSSPPSDRASSPMAAKNQDVLNVSYEKKEYPIDPSLPDIKNSLFLTDEFRMFSFKVRPCSRAYSHDWTECPFVHPGENARRRDPRKHHYSCVPCPEFRKGSCRRGDLCEYAHGVFECWLHPAQYRTRLCKDGLCCSRRVCFFAHTTKELRPLYTSTGSGLPSPRSSASNADMASAMNLLPGSPSSMMPQSPFAQSLSPSANGGSQSPGSWPQPNVPALHLPGSNLQSSRLRSSLNARDIPPEEFGMFPDFGAQQQLNDFACLSQAHKNSVPFNLFGRSKALNPSNLEGLFSAEMSLSPQYSDQATASTFSPSHKSAVITQFQQQQQHQQHQQGMLPPINTSLFSPKNIEHSLMHSVPSPGRMSPRSIDPISPVVGRVSGLAYQEKLTLQTHGSLGSNSVAAIVGSPLNSWSKWGSPNGKADWSVGGDGLSSSFEHGKCTDEPDVSWVQSLVKESPELKEEAPELPTSGGMQSSGVQNSSISVDSVDHSVLGVWLEQMQLDQLVA